MPVARTNIDTVSGALITSSGHNINSYVNDQLIAVVGDDVEDHWYYSQYHTSVTLVEGSEVAFVDGIPICRYGDAASCGCTIESGSDDTFSE